MRSEENSWMRSLFAYADGENKRLTLSVVLSVLSVMLGLVPFYCMYRVICLFDAGTATAASAAARKRSSGTRWMPRSFTPSGVLPMDAMRKTRSARHSTAVMMPTGR